MEEQQVAHNECQELKNIKYKTMLLTGVQLHETKSANDISNLDKFLEAEQKNNNNEPWCKLNKTSKVVKLTEYVEKYREQHNLDVSECESLTSFLRDSLDKKKLSRVKDVAYDKVTGEIKEIPALIYNKLTKHFTLKNVDKRVSTLKSLAPKKAKGTVRNKQITSKNEIVTSVKSEDDVTITSTCAS